MPELTTAMQEVRNEAKTANSKLALVRERVEHLQLRIKSIHDVADLTYEAEQADKRLLDLRDNKSAAARLGAELLKKNMKIGDMVMAWDKNREGEIDKPVFAKNVRKMGSEDLKSLSDEELSTLFESLDDDGGGTLDMEELKAALVMLRESSQENDKKLARLRKLTVDLWKAARSAQLERRKQAKADEAAAAAKAEQDAEDARVAAEAAERETVERVAKREAAKKRKEDEKAAYAAMIEERRKQLNAKAGKA